MPFDLAMQCTRQLRAGRNSAIKDKQKIARSGEKQRQRKKHAKNLSGSVLGGAASTNRKIKWVNLARENYLENGRYRCIQRYLERVKYFWQKYRRWKRCEEERNYETERENLTEELIINEPIEINFWQARMAKHRAWCWTAMPATNALRFHSTEGPPYWQRPYWQCGRSRVITGSMIKANLRTVNSFPLNGPREDAEVGWSWRHDDAPGVAGEQK